MTTLFLVTQPFNRCHRHTGPGTLKPFCPVLIFLLLPRGEHAPSSGLLSTLLQIPSLASEPHLLLSVDGIPKSTAVSLTVSSSPIFF